MVGCCAVYGCPSTKRDKNKSFFKFPKDKITCRQWIKACSRPDLAHKSEEDLYKSYTVCDFHFEMSSRVGTRLKKNSIPTLRLPQEECSPLTKYTQTIDLNESSKNNQFAVEIMPSKATQTSAVLSSRTPRKRKLLRDYTSEVKKRKILANELHDLTMNEVQKETDHTMPPQIQKLLQIQKKLHPHSRGNRYSREFKLFALSLFFAGPMAYRVLGKMICLPSERTLRRLNINTGTKISNNVIQCLEAKVKHLSESEKYCVLCADEMSLKRHLFYQINFDKIVGFHEVDNIQTAEPATQAFVIMARGLFNNWKQPIGYCFLARSKNYDELNIWLDKTILEIIRIGFKVVAFVSDQGSNFLSLASSRNVTITKPYFFVNEHKIFYIFDVPHLFKSLRNNLMKYDFEYKDDDGLKAVATWDDLKKFYEQDSKRVYRLAPKLTESHVNPNNFEKMKVKYATQVFSKTVAAGMSCSIELGHLDSKCIGTVKLIELVNNTFDILNSSVVNDPNKYKKSFSGLAYQMDTLNNFISFLNQLTIRNKANEKEVTNSMKCIKGFKTTLASIMQLREYLKADGYKFVFTRRLNQDVLENFFGSVRQQGGNCREPTPVQFGRAFRKLFMVNMLKHSEYANCSEDVDNLLLNTGELFTPPVAKLDHTSQCDNDPVIAIKRTDYRLEMPEQNAFQYVCGYLLRTCHDVHKCEGIDAYVKSQQQNINQTNIFMHNKAHNSSKDNCFGGLINPPDRFVTYIRELDKHVINVFKRDQFLGCLGNDILEAQSKLSFHDCCSCFPNDYLKKLFVRFRIYNVIGFNNRLLKCKSFRYKYISVSNL